MYILEFHEWSLPICIQLIEQSYCFGRSKVVYYARYVITRGILCAKFSNDFSQINSPKAYPYSSLLNRSTNKDVLIAMATTTIQRALYVFLVYAELHVTMTLPSIVALYCMRFP